MRQGGVVCSVNLYDWEQLDIVEGVESFDEVYVDKYFLIL